MEYTNKREEAWHLRADAEVIRRHGMGNFFEYTFACLRVGRLCKEDEENRCSICPVQDFVRAERSFDTRGCSLPR